MQKHMTFLVLVYALLAALACLQFGRGSTVEDYRNTSCIESEKLALLHLKHGLVDDFNYLSSWDGDDCCAWHGVGCNNGTGHVTRLDLRNGMLRADHIYHSLLDLKYLTYLDLSNNNFEKLKIPQFFGSFKDLTYLNLSYTNFEGLVPHHLGNLSKLRHLDLGLNYYSNPNAFDLSNLYNSLLSIDSMWWLSKLSSLVHLDLSYVNLSKATDWFSSINMLPHSIVVLNLLSCQLSNNIPRHLPFVNLTSLISLNLEENSLNSSFPLWVLNNSGLAHLSLRLNRFHGSIPDSLGTLTSLVEIDLSYNSFNGLINPESIGRLVSLSSLDLSSNEFQGHLPKSMRRLSSLTYLGLMDNNFQGSIPHSISNLTELTYLYMSSNELRGDLPEEVCQLSKLKSLDVSFNQMSGRIPDCIGQLSNLISLGLYDNSWEGFVTAHHFVNLTKLIDLSISSYSNLALDVSINWVPPFQLQFIYIESLKVGPKFPRWLLTQRQFLDFRMINTSISDTIPTDWFSNLLSHAYLVYLSDNDINVEQLSSISAVPNGLQTLALSNTRLFGGFPLFLCNITSLRTLVLSNNYFTGELPQCLANLTQLQDLDVMNNNFSGTIHASLGSLRHLEYLNFHDNNFQGKLPLSFQNLTELVILDVGKNNLSDVLPSWTVEQLLGLRILILRSNKFYGKIPTNLCHHPAIQVLNFAHNQIVGNIPPCFGNFSTMITVNKSDDFHPDFPWRWAYSKMIIDDAKGHELNYTSGLEFLHSIDLSNNNIDGEIPEELMDLRGLTSLKLAGNHLAGRIPERIGNLERLEFLDLSGNKLFGHIPQSLSNLDFLSHLNLSFNNLSGRLPTGNHIQTLYDPSINDGNNQLCGQPILEPCVGDTGSPDVPYYDEGNSDLDEEHVWFYAGIGPGLLVGFLGFCACLHYIKSWRYSYFHLIDRVFDKIVVAFALWKRKFQN
ncbi:hypothetical protein DCAR_0935123 [Daucus carota subsp. sativus]|uniref:Leucine-rich repeat-containing N-terminal plant-type domain-containing protein n=1 Tax=Daucus carota subsp. sativus TaxID=79200 RepID=A0AAF0XWI8_DAUCS|nr:hypothetical protein DCAR_0935123 [Daucus carota subsp. sativus]